MLQAKSFIVTGSTGTRNGKKETTLAGEVDKALNAVIEDLGDKFKSATITPALGLSDSVLVTVFQEAEPKAKSKK